jgi:hypothetical protein
MMLLLPLDCTGGVPGAGTVSTPMSRLGKTKILHRPSVAPSTEEDTTTARTASTTEHDDEAVTYGKEVKEIDDDSAGEANHAPVGLKGDEQETEKYQTQRKSRGPSPASPGERIDLDVFSPFGGDEESSELTFGHERVPKHVEGTHSCESSLTDDEDPDQQEEATILGDEDGCRLALPNAFAVPNMATLTREDIPLASRIPGRNVMEELLEVYAPAGLLGIAIDTPPNTHVPVIWSVKETSVLSGLVLEGDQLVAVDEVDVTDMSATEISALINSRSSKRTRTLTILRVTGEVDETSQGKDDEDALSPLNNMDRLLLDAAVALAEAGTGSDDLILCALSQSLSALTTNVAPDTLPTVVSPTRSVKSVRSAEDIVFDTQEMPYFEQAPKGVAELTHFDSPHEELEPVAEMDERTEPLIEILSIDSKPCEAWIFPNDEIKGTRRQVDKLPSVINIETRGSNFDQDDLGNAGHGVPRKKSEKKTKTKVKRSKKRKFAKERVEL